MNPHNFEESLKKPLRIMRILGMWPTNNPKSYWFYTIFIICTFLIPMVTLHMMNLLLDEQVSIVAVANCIFLNAEISIVPLIIPFWNFSQKTLKMALACLNSKMFNNYTNEHFQYLQEGAAAVRKTQHYITLCVVTVLVMAASPLAHWNEKWLFVDMWLPFDPRSNWLYYCCVHFYCCIGLMICCLTNSTIIALTCGLIIHATTQVKILKHNIMNITSEGGNETYYAMVSECAAHYAAIIEYVKLIDTSLSFPLTIYLLSCIVVVCLSAFLLTITPANDFFFAIVVLYMCCVVLETFLVCHYGEYLRNESLTISDATYFSQWQGFDMKTRKALIFFMERAKRPLSIAPAGIFILSNATFAKLIQRAYSFFTVLQNLEITVN